MSDESKKETSFKVNDQRLFDKDGRERNEKDQKGAVSDGNFTVHTPVGNTKGPEVTFTSFVMSLATQVLMQLGQLPPPEGMKIPEDREGAKQTIDILGMIEAKTKGNLDSEEARLLQDVLHSVRLCFLNAK